MKKERNKKEDTVPVGKQRSKQKQNGRENVALAHKKPRLLGGGVRDPEVTEDLALAIE